MQAFRKWTVALAGAIVLLGAVALDADRSVAEEPDTKKLAPTEARKSGPYTHAETWYTSTVARHEEGVMVVNYWSKGPLFRAETILSGHRINSVISGERYYIFDSVLGSGLSIERSKRAVVEDEGRGRPFGTEWQEIVRQGGELIRDGEVPGMGLDYELYQVTNDKGRKQVLVTGNELRLPLRVETFVRSAGETSTVEYTGWQRGLVISDGFFEPPSGIHFEELTYDEYVRTVGGIAKGPAPVFYSHLLHGTRED
jgi:hypothetical protein